MNEEDGEGGRLGSIHKECRISASQESYLKNCPFARESDVFLLNDSEEDLSPWTSIHTQLDRIVMVSPPESPKDNEVFQTPPEGSIIDSSQEKEAAAAAAADPVDSIPDRRIEGGDGYVVEEDDVYAEAAVNLVRDSDNLGFTSLKLTQVSNNVSIDSASKPLEIESSVIKENVNNQEEEEEEVEEFSSPEPVRKRSGSLLGEGTSSDKMVTDDLERFKYVSSSIVSLKRKGVSPVASNGDAPVTSNGDAPVNRNEILKALLEAFQVVTGKTNDGASSSEEEEEVDFLETAKKRGIVFPRPRWWPPAEEGTDD